MLVNGILFLIIANLVFKIYFALAFMLKFLFFFV